MPHAPIALFAYNRLAHIRRTVEALQKNELANESDLIIFSDAPKGLEAAAEVSKVREYIKTITGFRSIKIIERDRNLGLANSIIDGVTRLCKEYARVIVLEDDLVTSPFFLEYMNTALARYQHEEQVMQISGYMFPISVTAETDAVFLPMTTSWGWATWQRAWQHFDPAAGGYGELKDNVGMRHKFNLDGSYYYFRTLKLQMQGKIDSWAIRWHLSVWLRGGLTLFPVESLVENIGFDGSGTHGAGIHIAPLPRGFRVIRYPEVVVNENAKKAVYAYLQKQGGWIRRLRNGISRWFK